MRLCRLLCFVTAVAVLGFAPAPLPRKERTGKRDDMEVLQGVWRMTYQESGGSPSGHDFKARIRGDRWTFIHIAQGNESESIGYHLTLDQTVSPRAMEWAYDKNRTSGWVASYRIEGKKLTVVYTSGTLKNDRDRRPTSFTGQVPHKMIFEYVGRE